ncbi:MAG: hypothetical protein ACQXXF_06315 [Thermoplasmatota archaeon]|jgi:hypothetical protein
MEILKKIGSWLFLIGILVALILGVIIGLLGGFENVTWDTTPVAAVLAILGFIVGVLSFFALGTITKERVPSFLIGTLALVIIGVTTNIWLNTWTFGNYEGLVPFFTSITTCMAIFASPAAGLLAIRAIWDAGKSEEVEKLIPKI